MLQADILECLVDKECKGKLVPQADILECPVDKECKG